MGETQEHASVVEHYCEVSTCAGVIDWYHAKNRISKKFWVAMVVAGLAVTVWQVAETLNDYMTSDPFQTVISTSKNFQNLNFPSVTICNANRINRTNIDEQGYDGALLSALFNNFLVTYPFSSVQSLASNPSPEMISNYLSLFNFTGYDPLTLMRKYGHECNKTLVKMRTPMYMDNVSNPCQTAKEIVTNYGRCFVFNISEQQMIPGASLGLQLVLNPALHRYLTMADSNYLDEGIVMYISYYQEHYILDPIVLKPGSHAYISLAAEEKVYQQAKYPMFRLPCLSKPSLTTLEGDYTKRTCYYDLLLKFVEDNCQCVPPSDTRRKVTTCSIVGMVCLYQKLKEYGPGNGSMLRDNCLDPCESTFTLTPSTVITTFPSKASLGDLASAISTQMAMGNMLSLDCPGGLDDNCTETFIAADIYFPSFEASLITTSEAQPIFTFIGNIGGQLGLWTGMCVMTLVQFVYFFIYGCHKRCNDSDKVHHTKPPPQKGRVQFVYQ